MSTYSYTKLFSSITESTVWCEPAGTRLVWITLLAKCDRHGRFSGALPGLARLANVTLQEAAIAISTLSAPDPYSRTPEYEGRRIEAIDGGWRLLNHQKYRDMRDEESRREQNREAQRRRRAGQQNVSNPADCQHGVSNPADCQRCVSTSPGMSAHADADADAENKSESKSESTRAGARLPPNWEPSAEEREFAATERPDLNVDTEAAKFRDYWQAAPGAKGRSADWSATWRNWIRRADAPKGGGAAPPPPQPTTSPTLGAKRDIFASPESPLEREQALIWRDFGLGLYGEGEAAIEERDHLLDLARARMAIRAAQCQAEAT